MSAPQTLGRLLSREAERLLRRQAVGLSSVRGAAQLADRLARLPLPNDERFRRVDAAAPTPRAFGGEAAPADDWPGAELPARTRTRLRDLLGSEVERIRVHDGPAADRVAAAVHADAVTVGTHVVFRAGRYRADEGRGFALIAHEAAHAVASVLPGVAVRRSTAAGIEREESLARAVAHTALTPAFPAPAAVPAPAPPAGPVDVTSERPMRAAEDRATATPEAPSPVASLDLQQLRRTLFADLLAQLKCEAERGG
jgi:hypothetical protein